MLRELAAFVGVSVIVIVTPGPDTALTIRNTLLGGRTAGIATGAGVAALLVASEPVFIAIRALGAAYLTVLGARALWDVVRAQGSADEAGTAAPSPRLRPKAALRQGLLSDLGNPKMAVFFTSLLPQFAPRGGH